jgi:UDPglucose 6-dehydrogenase
MIENMFHTVTGKKITILGFAFKPDTGDTRDAPAIYVCKKLLEERAKLSIVDPQALENARRDLRGIDEDVVYEENVYKAVEGAHAIVLITEWKTFRDLDFERIYSLMAKPAFVFDGRNLFDADKLARIGFHVFPLGKFKLSSF